MSISLKFFIILIFIVILSQQQGNEDRGYVVGKHTFQAPFLFGITSSIPFWEYGGATVATENFIRLVPALQSKTGWIWNTEVNKFLFYLSLLASVFKSMGSYNGI